MIWSYDKYQPDAQENYVQLALFDPVPPKGVDINFQTPPAVCEYMARFIPKNAVTVLEPTPGIGNLSRVVKENGFNVTEPDNFFELDLKQKFDCVIMNPPFSSKYAFGVPDHIKDTGMRLGYFILNQCMALSDNIIALAPWFTISDSDLRLKTIKDYGLQYIIALPRKTFNYARIQTVILVMQKGYTGETIFKTWRFPAANSTLTTNPCLGSAEALTLTPNPLPL